MITNKKKKIQLKEQQQKYQKVLRLKIQFYVCIIQGVTYFLE